MNRKKSLNVVYDIFLALLGIALAIALAMRVFSFYTLTPAFMVFIAAYLALVLGSALFRFVRPALRGRRRPNWQSPTAVIVAGLATGLFFLLINYHIAPLLTVHTLRIQNTSETSEISVWEIALPGGESLDLAETFDQFPYAEGRLLIPPGESITFSHEMVGGAVVKVGAMAWPAQVTVGWDELSYDLTWVEDGNAQALNLPAWSLGETTGLYRILGCLNIGADAVSIFGLTTVIMLLLFSLSQNKDGELSGDGLDRNLQIYTFSILANLGALGAATATVLIFDERLTFILLLFGFCLLFYLMDLAREKPDWAVRIVIIALAVGVLTNLGFWINPPHELHQTLNLRHENSLVDFAEAVGGSNSKFLSIGYYRYLRESSLVITTPLYIELGLDEGSFRVLNQIRNFIYRDYDYQLSDSQAEYLFSMGDWLTWPTRIDDGELRLLPEISAPGDTYYCFSHGSQYFLVPMGLLKDSGEIDVPFVD